MQIIWIKIQTIKKDLDPELNLKFEFEFESVSSSQLDKNS